MVNKEIREHTCAHDSGVSRRILGVCKLSNINKFYELVMTICIERCDCEYVSGFVNLNTFRDF